MSASTLLCLSSRIRTGYSVDRFHINYYFENVLSSTRATFVGRLICGLNNPLAGVTYLL
jgi:hypothetical protein